MQSLESGHSEVLTHYLGAMARFHTYSFGNVMILARKKPKNRTGYHNHINSQEVRVDS